MYTRIFVLTNKNIYPDFLSITLFIFSQATFLEFGILADELSHQERNGAGGPPNLGLQAIGLHAKRTKKAHVQRNS